MDIIKITSPVTGDVYVNVSAISAIWYDKNKKVTCIQMNNRNIHEAFESLNDILDKLTNNVKNINIVQ